MRSRAKRCATVLLLEPALKLYSWTAGVFFGVFSDAFSDLLFGLATLSLRR